MITVPWPVNFSRMKPSPPLMPGPAALEGDAELDGGLGGHEGVLLGEPGARAVELQGAHLAGQHAREADGALAALRR